MNIALSILSGVLLALCFPKFDLSFLAWFALVPLFIAITRAGKPQESAVYSFISALFFFGITLFWINTLTAYAGPFATLGWIGLILLQGAFFMLFGFFVHFFKWRGSLLSALLYVFVEWLREVGPFGISAGGLGYTQFRLIPLIQIASITSVLGVSFLIVCSNICITNFFLKDRKLRSNLTTFILLLALSVSYGSYILGRGSEPASQQIKIAIIQPNIPQEWKLDMRYNQKVFGIHEKLTRSILKERPDLIIWPETMVLSYVMRNRPFLNRIEELAKVSNANLIFGTPFKQGDKIYNSVIALSPQGQVLGRYDKRLLVPFGEYLPLRPLFYPILKATGFFHQDFNSNPHPQMLDLKKYKIGAVVCFESSFIKPLKIFAQRGADLLLTVTNDAWFNDSAALEQHINCGVFRAIENRRPFVQVANTGISAVIDPYGRFLLRSDVDKREALTFKVALP